MCCASVPQRTPLSLLLLSLLLLSLELHFVLHLDATRHANNPPGARTHKHRQHHPCRSGTASRPPPTARQTPHPQPQLPLRRRRLPLPPHQACTQVSKQARKQATKLARKTATTARLRPPCLHSLLSFMSPFFSSQVSPPLSLSLFSLSLCLSLSLSLSLVLSLARARSLSQPASAVRTWPRAGMGARGDTWSGPCNLRAT